MKFFLFFLIFILASCSSQHTTITYNPDEYIYLDENRNEMKSHEYLKRWRTKENNLVRWDYIAKDTGRVATLFEPSYSRYSVSYPKFLEEIKSLTGREYSKNSVFILRYFYLNDLSSPGNNWNKYKIISRQKATSRHKKEIEKKYKNIIVLYFFEKGIQLQNSPDSKKEYLYLDGENFLRNTLFRNPSFYGSYALIKPNGETLVKNGESSLPYMEQHLKTENWDLFFETD